jgi:hypothetical protein
MLWIEYRHEVPAYFSSHMCLFKWDVYWNKHWWFSGMRREEDLRLYLSENQMREAYGDWTLIECGIGLLQVKL